MDAITPVTDPNSGITYVLKWPNTKPTNPFGSYNAAYPGTPKVGVCSMNGMSGASWLPGTLTILASSANCWVTLGGTEYADRGGQQMYVHTVDGVEWLKPPVSGKFPPNAIPSGYHVGFKEGGAGLGTAIAYTCRAKIWGKFDNPKRWVTRVGWTLDARTCTYTYYNKDVTTNFEVLTRLPSKAYKLDLTN